MSLLSYRVKTADGTELCRLRSLGNLQTVGLSPEGGVDLNISNMSNSDNEFPIPGTSIGLITFRNKLDRRMLVRLVFRTLLESEEGHIFKRPRQVLQWNDRTVAVVKKGRRRRREECRITVAEGLDMFLPVAAYLCQEVEGVRGAVRERRARKDHGVRVDSCSS